MSPRVTLVLPVYNGENYIEMAIDSILSQSFADFELVIMDNASVDNTEAICRGRAKDDSRIRYFRNERNLGAAPNYNLGFERARGEFFKWCAHDDLISENYLELSVLALDRDPEAVMSYGPSQMIDERGNPAPAESADVRKMDNPDAAWRFMSAVRTGGSCGAVFGLFRKSALARSLLHQPYYSSDRALLAEMALLGRFVFIPDITFYNRAHVARSMSLPDRVARMKWIDASAKNRLALERLPLLRQLFLIAWRHRQQTGLSRTIPPLACWAMAPNQLGSLGLEIISMIAPRLAQNIRTKRNKSNMRKVASI